jgi:hypothetical protein
MLNNGIEPAEPDGVRSAGCEARRCRLTGTIATASWPRAGCSPGNCAHLGQTGVPLRDQLAADVGKTRVGAHGIATEVPRRPTRSVATAPNASGGARQGLAVWRHSGTPSWPRRSRTPAPRITDRRHPFVALALVPAGRLRATALVAERSSGVRRTGDSIVAHMEERLSRGRGWWPCLVGGAWFVVVAAGGAVRAVRGVRDGGHAHIRGLAQDLCSSHVRCLKSSAVRRGGCSGD